MPASWSFWYDALPSLPPVVLCGIVVAILHVSHRQAIGSPWIFPWISTKKSVDMDVDMDGKFHIHGKPVDCFRRHPNWLWSNVSYPLTQEFLLDMVTVKSGVGHSERIWDKVPLVQRLPLQISTLVGHVLVLCLSTCRGVGLYLSLPSGFVGNMKTSWKQMLVLNLWT